MTYNVHKVIPISDINPARNTPVISRVFMISTVLVFILIQPKNQIELINFFYQYSAIPCELVNFAPLSESQFYNNSCFYDQFKVCLLYTSPSPRDRVLSRMPSSA